MSSIYLSVPLGFRYKKNLECFSERRPIYCLKVRDQFVTDKDKLRKYVSLCATCRSLASNYRNKSAPLRRLGPRQFTYTNSFRSSKWMNFGFFNLGSKICMTLEYWDMQHTWGKERLKLFCLKLCGKPRLQVYKDLRSLWASQTMLNRCVTERSGYRCSFVCVLEWSSAHFWSWLNDSYSCLIFSNAQADGGTVWPGTGIIKCEEIADEETFKTETQVPVKVLFQGKGETDVNMYNIFCNCWDEKTAIAGFYTSEGSRME